MSGCRSSYQEAESPCPALQSGLALGLALTTECGGSDILGRWTWGPERPRSFHCPLWGLSHHVRKSRPSGWREKPHGEKGPARWEAGGGKEATWGKRRHPSQPSVTGHVNEAVLNSLEPVELPQPAPWETETLMQAEPCPEPWSAEW